jgi:RNA 2',3'-cyclic 3'-phosphodiesterase
MSGRWRLFVAVELPDDVRAAITRAVDAIGVDPGLRWTPPDQLHVTLLFLGAVEPELVPTIGGRLAEIAAVGAPFRLSLAGFGQFPARGKARVLWVGLRDADGALASLATATKSSLRDLVVTEDRPFHAHVTVARAREPVRLPAGVLQTAVEPVIIDVGHVTLFRSHLGGGKPSRYEALQRWQLGAATP